MTRSGLAWLLAFHLLKPDTLLGIDEPVPHQFASRIPRGDRGRSAGSRLGERDSAIVRESGRALDRTRELGQVHPRAIPTHHTNDGRSLEDVCAGPERRTRYGDRAIERQVGRSAGSNCIHRYDERRNRDRRARHESPFAIHAPILLVRRVRGHKLETTPERGGPARLGVH